MSGKIFISYRRGDDSGSAGRLRDAMANRFGPDNVFFDVSTLRAGDSWKDQITHWLNNSADLVRVIGATWTPLLEARAIDVQYPLTGQRTERVRVST